MDLIVEDVKKSLYWLIEHNELKMKNNQSIVVSFELNRWTMYEEMKYLDGVLYCIGRDSKSLKRALLLKDLIK
jgi:hypothetical protein